jgi:hypothetical protein
MNKTALKILIGVAALLLAVLAALFSVIGLSKLFAGAGITIIAMASTLEASKLIVTSFLYQYWATINKMLRLYLLTSILIVASITSIGIYGYLSGAYQTTKLKYDLTQTQTDSLTTKKLYYEYSVASFKDQLVLLTEERKSIDQTVSELSKGLSNNIVTYTDARGNLITSTSSATRKALQEQLNQSRSRQSEINNRIDRLNDDIISYSDSLSRKSVEITQLGLKNEISSELGSLAYISRVLEIPMDKVVNILIILFIIVFDPLAICMVISYNFLNNKASTLPSNELPSNETLLPITNALVDIDVITPTQPSEQPQIQSDSIVMDNVITEIPNDATTPDPETISKLKVPAVSNSNNRSEEKARRLQNQYGHGRTS